jgi:ferredoxin
MQQCTKLYSRRRFLSSEVNTWLREKGFDEATANGMIAAFGGQVTLSDIKLLGNEGLKSLAESVKRELHSSSLVSGEIPVQIEVRIDVPRDSAHLTAKVLVGQTFYQLSKQNREISRYLECACSGVAACSTCHVVVDPKYFPKLPPAEEDELDMLDLAWGVTPTSRLGCQIHFTKDLDGLKVTVPDQANNFFS